MVQGQHPLSWLTTTGAPAAVRAFKAYPLWTSLDGRMQGRMTSSSQTKSRQ